MWDISPIHFSADKRFLRKQIVVARKLPGDDDHRSKMINIVPRNLEEVVSFKYQ